MATPITDSNDLQAGADAGRTRLRPPPAGVATVAAARVAPGSAWTSSPTGDGCVRYVDRWDLAVSPIPYLAP